MQQRAVGIVSALSVLAFITAWQLREGRTIDQLQHILGISFMIHGALFGAYLLRKPFARPLYAVFLGVGLLAVAFLMTPYSFAYPFPYHSGIQGRLISAAVPALIIAGVFSLFSTRPRATARRRPITPTA